MKIFFRELTVDDIPAIKEISKDIWEGEDYVPQVIENWLKDEFCMNYGSFKDKERKEMVGFGRVKIFNEEIAWLEGGRVRIDYQKLGIGREMIRYAIDYAKSVKAKVAQYDTSSKNLGSKALAKYFGFNRKKSINVLDADRKDIKLLQSPLLEVEKVTVEEAKNIYKKIDIGPGDEISMGWSYKSLKYISENDGEWYRVNSDAIVQKIKFKSVTIQESPEEKDVWIIGYGKTNRAFKLIQAILQEELKNKESKSFEIFCSPEIASLVETLGFSYYEGEPFGVVLYEKNLSNIN
ncbi:MAG: GNAT family N-acetyltransferase [Promethearchaeota archaeon]|jgi:GNAT superfamily N-acetyltransferase